MIWICPAGLLPRAFAGITKETSLLSQKSKCKDEMSQICHHVWRIYSRMRPTQSESKLRNTAGDQTVFEPLDIVEFKTITPQHFSLSDPVNLFIFFFSLKKFDFGFCQLQSKSLLFFCKVSFEIWESFRCGWEGDWFIDLAKQACKYLGHLICQSVLPITNKYSGCTQVSLWTFQHWHRKPLVDRWQNSSAEQW